MLPARLKAALAGCLLAIVGLVAGLILSEASYRIARRFVCLKPATTFFEYRSWGWTHIPNWSRPWYGCVGRRFEWRTQLAFNAHGLRDREYPYDKSPGTRRVLVLGDSATEAIQVPLEQTFAKLVEARLQRGGSAVEVINGGHAGFGTDNELLFYREEGRRYAPDAVVLVFNFQNDILENSQTLYRRHYEGADVSFPPKPWFRLDADDTLHAVPASIVATDHTGRGGLSSHFFLFRALERALPSPRSVPSKVVAPLSYEVYAPWDRDWEDAWRLTTRLIRELRMSVERDGARFAVALMPDKLMVDRASFDARLRLFGLQPERYDPERPRRAGLEFLSAEQIPFMDLLPALQPPRTGESYFYDWDVHLNAGGHAAVTPPLASLMQRQLDAR